MAKFLFESDEEFKQYMSDTLAYVNMQNTVSKLVSFVKPQYMIEFGSGNGATSLRLAKENPKTSIVAVDLREKMIGLSKEKLFQNRVSNVTFINNDLTNLENYNLGNANLILMMYSFKYIADPDSKKENFLKDLYSRMREGAYLIIGDTFLEEGATKEDVKRQLEDRYYNNSKDVFWNNLKGLSEEDIKYAFDVQTINRMHTKDQVKFGVDRDGVYYVSREWLKKTAKKVGFKVLLGDRLNSLSDTIFVLQK